MREPSYMIILPMDEKDIDNPNIFVENIEKNEHVSIQNASMDEERGFLLDVLVDGKPYSVVINPVNVQVPPYVRPQHAFSDEEYRMIEETKEGVSICMDFDEDNARCFRDQLRIIDALADGPVQLDTLIAGLDLSASVILPQLTLLQIQKRIVCLPGKRYALAEP